MTVRLTPLSLDDGMPMDVWQRARRLELLGGAPLVNLDGDRGGAYPAPQDSMGIDDWIRSRDWQAGGGSTIPEDVAPTRMAALSQAQMPVTGVTVIGKPVAAKPAVTPAPLTGRPGMAERIANSLNAIAAGPNTSAPIHEEGGKGTISRGAGRDLRVEGQAQIGRVHIGGAATGTLDPPTGRREISISGIRSGIRGVGLPSRIRVYTTPSGELDYESPESVTVGPLPLLKRGTYVIPGLGKQK